MKIYRRFIIYGFLFIMAAGFVACEEDEIESNSNDPSLPLTAGGEDIKIPGRGQYEFAVLSGTDALVTAHVPSSEITSLTITKTVNLEVDPSFGQNGTLTVDPSSFDSEYEFVYTAPASDFNQLVGFTFMAEKTDGSTMVSDLTLVVNLSPRDNIPFRRWNLVSRLWVDAGNAEDLKECEKDNYYLFNADGTMSLNYGTDTGTGDCAFDGFKVYDTWELSEDEKILTLTRHDAFSGEVETEVYRVILLTNEEFQFEIDLDLSVFGLSSEETFRYFLEAGPK